MFQLKLISLLLILAITLLAGYYPFFKKFKCKQGNDFPYGESLAAGVFLGAGLIHMLGNAERGFLRAGYHYPFAFLLAGVTFLILLLLEHIGREIYEHQGETSAGFAILAVLILSIHSFLAGSALGLSQTMPVYLVIFLAILAHKWAASFALSVQINKSQMGFKLSLMLFLIFALMLPLGLIFGTLVTKNVLYDSLLEPIFSSLAAGTFLYLGTLHGLKRAVMIEKCCNLERFTFVIIGFAIMAIVAIWT